ncbi:histidine phosphatase family protein [Thalassotalea crassostreae]|uniref:histidine phosphatase family protein n=1 Tax=Thalassotalea crassostreae TaxID=1763536 RepID=UPI0008392D7D|nr:histidine phosphatase family protein [Thalassotalea crassostreae]
MTNIFLMRHGKVDGPPALYGRTDVSVVKEHDQQLLTQLLTIQHQFSYVLSSPLKRCKELATEFSKASNKPLAVIDSLAEINFGDYDGVAFDSIPEHWPTLEQFWQNPSKNQLPNSESLELFVERLRSSWQSLLQRYQGEDLLIICHGGVIRMLLSLVLDLDWQNPKLFSALTVNNGSITKLSKHEHADYCQVTTIGAPIESTISSTAASTRVALKEVSDD